MDVPIEELLTRLETVSADAVTAADPTASAADAERVSGLIAQRGRLIEAFQAAVSANAAPLSYTDWNRLVIVHHQGVRAFQNLQRKRSELASELAANSRERAFLECITGMVDRPPASQIHDVG